jgi:tetratricopeptide (TPR) repeat protein
MTASRGPSKDSPLERFEARAQHVFDWIGAHPRQVLGGIGGAVLLGLLVTGIYEWNERRQDAAHEALAKVERRFAEEFAGDPRVAILPEPANADQARRAREDALAGFLAVADAHSGSRAADFAQLRAAEMEVDLGQLDAAEQRLLDLDLQLGRSDSLRAVALRLSAYVHDLRGDYLEAGEAYLAGAEIDAYPDSPMLWLAAAQSFERGGAADRAVLAYQAVLANDPELGEREGVLGRIELLESASYRGAAAGGEGAPEPVGTPTN